MRLLPYAPHAVGMSASGLNATSSTRPFMERSLDGLTHRGRGSLKQPIAADWLTIS